MEIRSRFPFFRKNNYTYLDSAATTQVPDVVIQGISQVLEYRGNPNRSAHVTAVRNEELLNEARNNIAKFLSAQAQEIVFSSNATGAINLAVDSIAHLIKKGDEIIISVAEHNSNILPYLKLVKNGAKIKFVGIKDGIIDTDEVKSLLNGNTKIVAIAHCSNVLGNINNVEEIGDIIKDFNENIFYFIDGTQAVAHVPVDVKKNKADFYVFSSHKMYGPDGVGVLYINNFIHHLLAPIQAGGGTVKNIAVTYGRDKDIVSPEYHQSLQKLEGGTPNTSNILGLSKAVNYIRSIGIEEIRNHELKLLVHLLDGLKKFEEITVFGPTDLNNKIGLVSFGLNGYSVKELGEFFAKKKICVRYGAHCAFPLAEKLGQESLRVSFGIYNEIEDVDHILEEMKFFFDSKKGLVINQNLELLKNNVFYKNTVIVHSFESHTSNNRD